MSTLGTQKWQVSMKARTKPRPPEPYHHGNLRHALLGKALARLRTQGAEGLSLRELARDLGVSQAAPYRHFADKESLLAELAMRGFRELARDMKVSIEGSDPIPAAALHAAGLSYVRFAVRHPEQYRLMFGNYRLEKGRYAELDAAATEAFGLLRSVVQRGVEQGTFRDESVAVLAVGAWSIVHGFASLVIDGRLDVESNSDDSVLAEQVTRLFRTGIEAPRPSRAGLRPSC